MKFLIASLKTLSYSEVSTMYCTCHSWLSELFQNRRLLSKYLLKPRRLPERLKLLPEEGYKKDFLELVRDFIEASRDFILIFSLKKPGK